MKFKRIIQVVLLGIIILLGFLIFKSIEEYDETVLVDKTPLITEWHVYYGNTIDTIFAETCEIAETPTEGRSRYNSSTYLYSYRSIRFLTDGRVVAFYNFDAEYMGKTVSIKTEKSYKR